MQLIMTTMKEKNLFSQRGGVARKLGEYLKNLKL